MKRLIATILRRPVGVLVVSVSLLVLGAISFLNIPLQFLPEGFEPRRITVSADLRDASAAEAERLVAIPLEESLATVSGIESMSTRCSSREVRISIELRSDVDPTVVEADVRDRVRRVEGDLPDDVSRLRVRRRGANDRPVIFFACTAKAEREELSGFVEDVLNPRLESVDGVARASSWGLIKRSVRIWLDNEEIARRQLDLRDVLRRVRGDNFDADLGDVDDAGRTSYVRATMEFNSLDEIRDLPVGDGIRMRDIARVEIVPSLDQGWSRYNGAAVIVGTIYKMAGANTVETSKRVNAMFQDIVDRNPQMKDLELRPFFDQGKVIESSLNTLYKNALYGGVLAVVILFLFFRRFRMTLLVALAIPLSLTVAVTALYLTGNSLNIASMMGLTLAVGMLIDNAIVVVESILRRREFGDAPDVAAARGTGEVALAVLTATLTTIVVIAPAIFLSGETDARLWLVAIGGPIGYSLIASLAVALILIPLGSIHLRRRDEKARVVTATATDVTWFSRVLGFALRHRIAVVIGVFLLIQSAAIPNAALGRQGARGRASGPIRFQVRFPRHYTMGDANETMKRYEEYVDEQRDALELDGIYARFDRRSGMVMLWKRNDSSKPRKELLDAIKDGMPQVAGVRTSLEAVTEEGKTKITLEGEDAALLEATMERIEARLNTLPNVAETGREQDASIQELRIEVDREAVARGVIAPDRIRGMMGWVVRGARLKDYRAGGRSLPLLIELDPDQSVDLGNLGELLIPTDQGMKPLSVLSQMSVRNSAATIERRDGRRVAEMTIASNGKDDRQFHSDVQATIGSMKLPPGVRFQVGGSWSDFQRSSGEMMQALLWGAIFVFLLTGVLFESVLLPIAVIGAVIPALIGGLWGLYIAGKPMDELSLLGAILLVGIVVNNGIVLVDRAQQWRRAGLPLRAAIRAAGRDRVRPVVMTALTTIAGLLPMAVIKGAQDEIQYDTLATAVIGGLVVSTVVTLVFVPVLFSLFVDLNRITRRARRRVANIWQEHIYTLFR